MALGLRTSILSGNVPVCASSMASSVEADHVPLGAGLMCVAREGQRELGTPRLTGSATCPDGCTASRDPPSCSSTASTQAG